MTGAAALGAVDLDGVLPPINQRRPVDLPAVAELAAHHSPSAGGAGSGEKMVDGLPSSHMWRTRHLPQEVRQHTAYTSSRTPSSLMLPTLS